MWTTGMRWEHERAEIRGGTEPWTPLLPRPELLFPGLTSVVAQLPSRRTGRKQVFSTVDSTPTNPVGAVHGSDVEHNTRKVKMGLQDTKKYLGRLERVVVVA